MRIIKEGIDLTKEKQVTCDKCGCVVGYMEHEVLHMCLTSMPPIDKSTIRCPNRTCNNEIVIHQSRG